MKSKLLDTIGISAAALCLIHCLVFPLLLLLPLGLSHNPFVDLVFLIIGAVVVYRITRDPNIGRIRYLFWLSIGLISVSVFADLIWETHLPLIYAGAVGLTSGHIINFKNHRH